MKIKSKATAVEMEISDETWAQYKAQGLASKFSVVTKGKAPSEVTEAAAEPTEIDTNPKAIGTGKGK